VPWGTLPLVKNSSAFVANLLQVSASGYAGVAAAAMLKKHPSMADRFGVRAFDHWKAHLEERIGELATALAYDEPSIFTSQVLWSRTAFVSRNRDVGDLQTSLEVLADVLSEKLPQGDADSVIPILEAARALLERPMEEEPRLDSREESQRLALRYLELALDGERRKAASLVLDLLEAGRSLLDICEQIVVPAQREIGRLWHRGELNVAEEHLATAISLRALSVLSQRCETEPPNGWTAVVAGLPGNVHDMAVRIAAEVFEQAGWKVVDLGSDLPLPDLVEGIGAFAPDLVLFSASMPQQLPALQAAVSAIRQTEPRDRPAILVGGRAFRTAPDLWRRVGGDGFAADLREALDEARRLVETKSQT